MKDQNLARRSFIKTTAGAVTAAPSILRGSETGKTFRMGFIGMGRRGRNTLRAALKQPDIDVIAISEIYQPNVSAALEMIPDAKVYSDFRDLIAAPDIDAVCIATPDHWHAYMTIEACKAGKDVYVEKPISVTVHEGQLMVQAARKYKRIVQVGTQQRSGKHFQKVVDIIRNGEIGDISFVRSWNYSNAFPGGIGNPPDQDPPADLDWNMWLGPAPKRSFNANRFGVHPNGYSNFRWFWDYAGGMMTDWGVHLLDIVLWAMNEKGPRVVTTIGNKYTLADNRETPDVIQASFEFPNFVCVYENRVTNEQSMSGHGYGITFHGTSGTLFVDRRQYKVIPEMRSSDAPNLPMRDRGREARIKGKEGRATNNSTDDHWSNFVTSMKSRELPICDIEIGHRSTLIALLGNIAMRSRQRVEWNPDSETTPNKEAQTYLRREYRSPWKLEL